MIASTGKYTVVHSCSTVVPFGITRAAEADAELLMRLLLQPGRLLVESGTSVRSALSKVVFVMISGPPRHYAGPLELP